MEFCEFYKIINKCPKQTMVFKLNYVPRAFRDELNINDEVYLNQEEESLISFKTTYTYCISDLVDYLEFVEYRGIIK